jgi:hypothetical protein
MGVLEGVEAARPSARPRAGVAVDAGAAAWLLALPCALLAALAIALLGPPLGRLLHAGAPSYTLWRDVRWAAIPEPTEQARYLLALGAPLLLALAMVGVVRRGVRLAPRAVALGVPAVQALGLALVAICVVVQERRRYEVPYYEATVVHRWRYFTPPTLAAAVALAVGALLALRSGAVRARLSAWARETRTRRLAALAAAVVLTAIWMLHAVNTDASILGTSPHEWQPATFTLDETYAVVNGRTPLVDFTAQYGSLWPYASALALVVFGKSFLVFSLAMCAITVVALLAVYGILRRVTRSALLALALYLPFLATSLFKVGGTNASRYTFGDYFGVFPLRYAGPYLVAWLLARRLERGWSVRASLLLFTAAGLTILNNVELGIAALAGCLAARLWTAARLDARAVGRLTAEAAGGLLAALALLSILTLVRAGALPQLGRLTDYAREYTASGFGLLPLGDPLGLHLVVYLTYVAAIATATVRALDRAPDRVLTGMLAWCGVFGLGAGSYFMGRTHPELLIAMFSIWALTLALLSVAVVRALVERPRARPSLAALATLAGLGLVICSLAQLPAPWTQVARLQAGTPSGPIQPGFPPPPAFERAFMPDASTRDFFTSGTGGARVAILLSTGHEIADAFGLVDVSRYTGVYSMPTRERLATVVADLRREGGTTIFLPDTYRQVYATLTRWGFARSGGGVPWGEVSVTKWIDTGRRPGSPG